MYTLYVIPEKGNIALLETDITKNPADQIDKPHEHNPPPC